MSSLLLLLQPAGALALADAVLGERPTLMQVGGALLVFLGVLAVTWKGTRQLPARKRPAEAGELELTAQA